MVASGKMEEDGNWGEKKVEVKEDLRTVECLRGRLLAERQASKFANEDAEQMGHKLMELENQLKEETKLRDKAEKKLRFLKKKLESLNISIPVVDESEQSNSSSDICAHSCKSSTTIITSGLKDSEESSESRQKITTPPPPVSENFDYSLSDTISSSNHSHEITSFQQNTSEHSSLGCKDSKPDDDTNTNSKAEMEAENESEKERLLCG